MAMLLDPLLSESISNLFKAVVYVTETTANFKPQLQQLTATLRRIKPIIDETVNLNRELDRTELECKMFTDEIQTAEKLVLRCSKVKWDIIKMFRYSQKLNDFHNKLLRFFQIEVQAIQIRNCTQMLVMENNTNSKVDRMYADLSDMLQRTGAVSNHGGSESVDREKYGWHVPRPPSGIVGFGEPLEKLKAEVVGNGGCEDSSVLVVAAPGGCGKTTLAKMLCDDAEIREMFGGNIFFVTVSETPNLMAIASDLFDPNSSNPRILFQSNEDAKNKLENFFNQKASDPMLLVLDDVWSYSFIEEIVPLKIKGHKVLVTSRTAFPKYKSFRFDPLSEEDSKTLFCGSAFTEGGSRPTPIINDNLVNQMVHRCKKHPLTLLVVGRSLNGKNELAWKSMLGKLSQGRLVLDLHKDVLIGLERSFEALDDQLKQCFSDFGLFLKDQRIPVTTLSNMWMHLYGHDADGVDTMDTISELSYGNLVDLMTTGSDSGSRINHCNQQFVTQHDLLRELAIHLNNKLPLEQRSRLIINTQGKDLAAFEKVRKPLEARILSISTGESFFSQGCHMEVPDLEVLILNLMSDTYTLPQFLSGLQKLKIIDITNRGLHPTEFNNFQFLTSSHNLTNIRLERIDISPSILSLINLQKASFIMCKTSNVFKKLITNTPNILPKLVEIEIDNCQDLVEFPGTLCNSVHLKKISITNCHEMYGFGEEFGDLTSLETLTLRGCTNLETLPDSIGCLKQLRYLVISDCSKLEYLPESIGELEKFTFSDFSDYLKFEKFPESIWGPENLSFLNISYCLSLIGLPEKLGKEGGLGTIYMRRCTSVHELPEFVKELYHGRVECNEEIAYQWLDYINKEYRNEYKNVEIDSVEERLIRSPYETHMISQSSSPQIEVCFV
ncbi:hypothetical protein LXL04_016754 [Taraxacum kok-saghyz]